MKTVLASGNAGNGIRSNTHRLTESAACGSVGKDNGLHRCGSKLKRSIDATARQQGINTGFSVRKENGGRLGCDTECD